MKEVINKLESVLKEQHYGVFATIRSDTPHLTLVSFAVSNDLSKLIFFSPNETRKSINSKIHNKVSFFVDNKKNSPDDIHNASTITVYGRYVDSVEDDLRDSLMSIYLEKNPHMKFFKDSGTQIMVIDINFYEIVTSFHTITKIKNERGVFKIINRQIQGQSWVNGQYRGNIWDPENLDNQEGILRITSEFLNVNFSHFDAIITNQLSLKDELSSLNCPVVYVEEIEQIPLDSSITVDADLGVLIFHSVT